MTLAPIVLFVYNRLWHTQQTLESLQRNELAGESELSIYSDAPRNENDRAGVEKVREYIRDIQGFKLVSIIERSENYGVDKSIIAGVTEVIDRYGKIIVLEDDLESHPQFLTYMNNALEKYKSNRNVFSITGYSYTNNIEDEGLDDTYFLQLTNSWSWATWKNRWDELDTSAAGWEELRRNSELRKRFDFDNAYPYAKMLETQMKRGINTWDILWYWTAFRRGGLTLYPAKALVRNIGYDGSGVHCADIGNDSLLSDKKYALSLSEGVIEKKQIREHAVRSIRKKYNHTLYVKIKLKLKKYLSGKG